MKLPANVQREIDREASAAWHALQYWRKEARTRPKAAHHDWVTLQVQSTWDHLYWVLYLRRMLRDA